MAAVQSHPGLPRARRAARCREVLALIISDLAVIEGRRYPARRRTQSLVGGAAPIRAAHFALGHVTLDPDGGQVPWHNQAQEEVYFVIEGKVEMCLGGERQTLKGGQAVYIPSGVYHQVTNVGSTPARMLYCYGPAGDVAHWRQELDGTLPRAGIEAPPLPEGARPQCTDKPV
jgi:mannose-6-phosphate isomerase-like protein (cupin superfamily)